MAFLLYSVVFIGTWIFYNYASSIFEEKVQGKPPMVENSWLDFLTGKSANVQTLIKRGYEQYSKKGLPFRYNAGVGDKNWVMPPSHFASVRKSLDSVIDSTPANENDVVLEPFLGGDVGDFSMFVWTDVRKSINALIPTLTEEITTSMRAYFPSKSDAKHPLITENGFTWSPTNIHTATLSTVGRVITKILLGQKYSSNRDFTLLISKFAQGIIFQSFLLRKLPRWLCFKIAPLFNTTRRIRKIEAYVKDDVLALIRHSRQNGNKVGKDQLDQLKYGDELLILPMLVDFVVKQERYANCTDDELVRTIMARLLGIAFATIDTTTLTLTNVVHNLLGNSYATYAGPIVEQARQVVAKEGGQWTIKSLAELKKLDSFIKEVQRLRPGSYILGKRQVMQEGGAVFTSGAGPLEVPGYEGVTSGPEIYVPKGGILTLPTWGLHSDEKVYEDAETFKGFRFAEDRIASSEPTDRFQSFGHGRHACPGRHVALTVIKLFVLEFLETFEIKEGQERLKEWTFHVACLPDMNGRVLIRKKDYKDVDGVPNGSMK